MKRFPLIVFCIIILSALCTGIRSYSDAEYKITEDVNNALSLTLAQMPGDVVSADTIKCYRSYITIAALKDTACIAMRTVRRHGRLETVLVADANCDALTVFRMSDQKASTALLGLSLLWMLGSVWYIRRQKPQLSAALASGQLTADISAGHLSYGGIVYWRTVHDIRRHTHTAHPDAALAA